MKNKKAVEKKLFALALHMKGCRTCIEFLLKDNDPKASPACTEYQQLKAEAKALAKKLTN